MDQASFVNFIKTIFFIILIYYFIKFALRFLAPYLVKKAINKVNENIQKQQEAFYKGAQQKSSTNQGFKQDIKKSKIPKEKKKVGEYIDFEEIDD